jgi:hypothetical protein
MFKVEYFTVDATSNYVDLSSTPTDTSSVSLDVVGGTAQAMSVDFDVEDGTRVSWEAFPLDSQFDTTADIVRVMYDQA